SVGDLVEANSDMAETGGPRCGGERESLLGLQVPPVNPGDGLHQLRLGRSEKTGFDERAQCFGGLGDQRGSHGRTFESTSWSVATPARRSLTAVIASGAGFHRQTPWG